MEFLFFIAILVIGWWAWSARKTQQTNLTYQIHKDALAEAEKLAERARKRLKVKAGSQSLPIEFIEPVLSTVENIEYHVENSSVTKGLGDKEWLKELAEEIQFVRAVLSDRVPDQLRTFYRERFYDRTFADLAETVDSLDRDMCIVPIADLRVERNEARQALEWFTLNEARQRKTPKSKAKKLIAALNAHIRKMKQERADAEGAEDESKEEVAEGRTEH